MAYEWGINKTKNMKSIKIIGYLLIIAFFTSCEISRPIAATSNELGTKTGKASAIGILLFPPFAGQETTIEQAAKNAGITKISTVDYSIYWYVFFTRRVCTVTGN